MAQSGVPVGSYLELGPKMLSNRFMSMVFVPSKNYFTSSDPHHDMSGGGCQVGVVRVNWKCYLRNLDNSTYHPNS